MKGIVPNFKIRQLTFTNLDPEDTCINLSLYRHTASDDINRSGHYLSSIYNILNPPVIQAANIDLQRIVIRSQNVFADLVTYINWVGLERVNDWLAISPNLIEISMETLPTFRRLTGPWFMISAMIIAQLICTRLINAGPSITFNQHLKLLVFTDESSIDQLIVNFPNLTELYYLEASRNINDSIDNIDKLIGALDKLETIRFFTDNRDLASDLGKYYIESGIVKIHLV